MNTGEDDAAKQVSATSTTSLYDGSLLSPLVDKGGLISINNYNRENTLVIPELKDIVAPTSITSPTDLLKPFFDAINKASTAANDAPWEPAKILANNAEVVASPIAPEPYVTVKENATVTYADIASEDGKKSSKDLLFEAVAATNTGSSSSSLPLLAEGTSIFDLAQFPITDSHQARQLAAKLPEGAVFNDRMEVVSGGAAGAKGRSKRGMPFSKHRHLPEATTTTAPPPAGPSVSLDATNVPLPNSFLIQGQVTIYCSNRDGSSSMVTNAPARCGDANTVKNVIGVALAEQLGSGEGYTVTASTHKIPDALLTLLGPEVEPLLAAMTPEPIDGCPGWTTYSIMALTINAVKAKPLAAAWEAVERDPTSLLVGLNTVDPSLNYCGASLKHIKRDTKGSWTITDQLTKGPAGLSPTLTVLTSDQKAIASDVTHGSKLVVVTTNFPAGSKVEVSQACLIMIWRRRGERNGQA